MRALGNLAGVLALVLALMPVTADAAIKTIRLSSRGEMIGITPAIADGDQIRVCIGGGSKIDGLKVHYALRTAIETPDRQMFLASTPAELKFCDPDNNVAESTATLIAAQGYGMMAYWVTGVARPVPHRLREELQKQLDAANKIMDPEKAKIASAKAELALLDAEIKQLTAGGSTEAAKEIIALQVKVRAETTKLKTAEAIVDQHNEDLGDVPARLLKASSPPGLAFFRLGAAIIGDHRKTIHYRVVREGSEQQPLRLEPAGPYPVLTKEDELFAVINNVQPTQQPNRFVLTFTSEIGKPPDPAPVRPSVDPSKLGAGDQSIKVEQELSAAYADAILAFGRPLKANEVIKTTITTYAPSITSDKTTTTDGKAQQVVVTELTNVKLIEASEYPQVRDRYHFNLTTGVVSSGLRDPVYTKVKSEFGSAPADARYVIDENTGSRRGFPVLLFSFYWKPKDIQQRWSPADLIPVPTVGMSLTTPKDDYFGGFQSEIRRNVQLVYGFHWGRVTTRGRHAVDEDRTDTAVLTHESFARDTFVGLSFNVNFIKDLFK